MISSSLAVMNRPMISGGQGSRDTNNFWSATQNLWNFQGASSFSGLIHKLHLSEKTDITKFLTCSNKGRIPYPGGSVVKNPSTKAGDAGLILD